VKYRCTSDCVCVRACVFGSQQREAVIAMLTAVVHTSDINFHHDTDTDGVYIENEEILEIGLLSLHNLFHFLWGGTYQGSSLMCIFLHVLHCCVKTRYNEKQAP